MKEIGETFLEKREEIGITKEEVASDLKVDPLLIENLESGNHKVFKDNLELKEVITNYAKYLGLDEEELLDDLNDFLFETTSKISIEDVKDRLKEEERKKENEKKIKTPYTLEVKQKKHYTGLVIGILILIILVVFYIILIMFPFYRIGFEFKTFLFHSILIDIRYIFCGVIFILASFTDYLDGYLARKNKEVTDFGKLTDAIADKVLVNSVLIIFAAQGFLPAIVPVIIVVRDIIVDAIKMNVAGKGKVQAAKMSGKI